MADMMAIVSKAVFEKAAGKDPKIGTALQMDRYVSANKALEPLSSGGKLYLVTVRPPNEALWLVAILEKPKHDGKQWIAKPSPVKITDISKLRSKIKFESGVGITDKKGALGMSLQTPRTLTAADCTLLDKAAGVDAVAGASEGDFETKGIPAPPSAPAPIGRVTGEKRGSLLDAILENPESVEARQVYGDQLAQNNDPRGEFILVEVALDGPLSIRKRETLVQRRQELLREHSAKWWPYTGTSWRTHRGFIKAVSGSWKQIEAIASELFAAEPVTEISLGGMHVKKDFAALMKAPWLPRIHRLILRGIPDGESFQALANAPQAANLRALNVTANELESDAFADIANGLPRCTNLVLSGNPIGDDGLIGLVQWKALSNVDTLYLSSCDIGDIESLINKANPTKLKKLTLSSNQIGNTGATILAKAAARMPELGHLELVRTGIESAGAKALMKADFGKLRRLDLRGNFLDEKLAASDPRVRL